MLSSITRKLPATQPAEFSVAFFAFTAFMGLGGVVWGGLSIYFGLFTAAIIPFGYVVASALNLTLWRWKGNFAIARLLQVAFSILLPFLFQAMLGGYQASGAVMLWALLALIACLTFYDNLFVLVWFFFFVGLVLVSVFYEAEQTALRPDALESTIVQQVLLVVNISMVSMTLFFLGNYFIGLQRNTLQEVRLKNIALKRSEAEKEMAYQEILASEEELRQNAEELRAINEELLNTKNELEEALQREAQAKVELGKAKDSEIAQKNQKIMSSLHYAERIQRALLPSKSILNKYFPENFIYLQPRDIVSGDFYWFQEVEGETAEEVTLVIAAADCTGHGVPAAFMSVMGHNALNNTVRVHKITEPDKILESLNEIFIERLQTEKEGRVIRDGMDIAVCTVQLAYESGTWCCKALSFAGAKNGLLLITPNGKIHQIKGTRKPIGADARNKYKQYKPHALICEKGAMIYLFSDGFQDQFGGPRQEKFLGKRFRQLLYSIHQESPETQQELLAQVMKQWRAQSNQPQMDDILVMGIKI